MFINETLYDIRIINISEPHGCILSVVLCIIYTNVLRSQYDNCVLIKCVDDTVIFGLITNSHIIVFFYVAKTKISIFDFIHCDITPIQLIINNDLVEISKTFKYLGVTIGNKLTRSKHCATVVSKYKQRLFFLGLLNSFYVNSEILHIVYTSMIECNLL